MAVPWLMVTAVGVTPVPRVVIRACVLPLLELEDDEEPLEEEDDDEELELPDDEELEELEELDELPEDELLEDEELPEELLSLLQAESAVSDSVATSSASGFCRVMAV